MEFDSVKLRYFQDFIYEHYNLVVTRRTILDYEVPIKERFSLYEIQTFEEYFEILQNKKYGQELKYFLSALNIVSIQNIEMLFSFYLLLSTYFKNPDKTVHFLSFNKLNSIEHAFLLIAIAECKKEFNIKQKIYLYLVNQKNTQKFILHRKIFSLTDIVNNPMFSNFEEYFQKVDRGYILKKEIFQNVKMLDMKKALSYKNTFDLILYKNWTIFLSKEQIQDKVDLLLSLLTPASFLLIGKYEVLDSDKFQHLYLKKMIVHQKK